MPLFGKKRTDTKSASGGAPRSGPVPPTIGDGDLERAGQVLSKFEDDSINHRDIKTAVLAFAIAGGAPDFEEATKIMGETGEFPYQRPWQWLAAVAQEAYRRNTLDLVAHISFFIFHWKVTPELQHIAVGDAMEMRIAGPPPNAIVANIYSVALRALPQMDPEAIVVETPTATLTTLDLLNGCAGNVIDIGTLGPELTESAHQVLGR